jgi:hypothetical protein
MISDSRSTLIFLITCSSGTNKSAFVKCHGNVSRMGRRCNVNVNVEACRHEATGPQRLPEQDQVIAICLGPSNLTNHELLSTSGRTLTMAKSTMLSSQHHDGSYREPQFLSCPPPSKNITLAPLLLDSRSTCIPTRLVKMHQSPKFRFISLEQPQILPPDYVIQRHDVTCWPKGVRSCDTPWNAGNERFRIIVQMRVERYRQASSRLDKMNLCKEGVEAVREAGGRFVRRIPCHSTTATKNLEDQVNDDGTDSSLSAWQWVDIGNKRAREKVGHALRQEVLKQSKRSIDLSSMLTTMRPSKKRCSFSDSSWSTQETACTSTSSGSDSCDRSSACSPILVVDESPACKALGSTTTVPGEDDEDGLLVLANKVWCPFESDLA